MANSKIKLSIIILNYNSRDYLKKCLESIAKSKANLDTIETIVVDNFSTDESTQLAQKVNLKNAKFLLLKTNKGFAAGNNRGVKITNPSSKYVLFLNPDTTVESNTLQTMIDFFDQNKQVDAATCFIKLAATGFMQPECHRGFPTPWNSFCYFSGISKLFPKSTIFNGYFQGNLDTTKVHQIEACVGAFLMVKKGVGQKINWWNEKFFFYGEDLDFCYQLKQNGFKLFFNPNCKITHFQGISSGLKKTTNKLTKASRKTKITVAKASTNAMRIFYKQNLFKNYSLPTRFLVLFGIKLLELKRVFKAKYL
jgi:GT2 family glycosyltransferase